ncbi:glycosyltransferase family 2 protein [Sunxiuqinia rutila]|uniref:glycosyltransferase family 2 protein n=1 Tax=Sunxiuqinia rutila TaxID=1397841 RepID=UPI003D35FC0A
MANILFWTALFIVAYTYIGYALVIWVLATLKQSFRKSAKTQEPPPKTCPEICLFVTAYNEADMVDLKVQNSLKLNYPKEKIQYLWLTDGSNDGTKEQLKNYPEIQVEHLPERRGKIHAMNRGMQFVEAPFVIFSDSNTLLNQEAIRKIVLAFQDPQVGCVAGEKRICEKEQDNAAASGEGFYWKLESFIKQMDARFNSTVGAAGELFAIRTSLYHKLPNDTLLDDFMISIRIAAQDYKVAYTSEAYALETASASVKEELKRKTRIAAGGIQSLFRFPQLLNPFRFGWLSFQYFSHKVLRWTIAPFALFLLFFINFLILSESPSSSGINFYVLFFCTQAILYLLALVGFLLENRRIHHKALFIPYYFVAMNLASILGIIRYFRGRQSPLWEKAKRSKV